MNFDLIIVGAGPAGIFTALEMLRNQSKAKILLIEKGKPVEKRHCPKAETGKCVNCKPSCAITTGFSGAGAFSDGKLSLSYEVGGDLPDLIGATFAQELIDYTDKIYLEFGADPHIEGIGDDFIPAVVDQTLVDGVMDINDLDAIAMAAKFGRVLGLGVGISSGANFLGSVIQNLEPGRKVATVFADDSKKYLTTMLSNPSAETADMWSSRIELLDYEPVETL